MEVEIDSKLEIPNMNYYSSQEAMNKKPLQRNVSHQTDNLYSVVNKSGILFWGKDGKNHTENINNLSVINKILSPDFAKSFSDKFDKIFVTKKTPFQIHQEFSRDIKEILLQKYKIFSQEQLQNDIACQLLDYYLIFSYFDSFIVNNENPIYIFKKQVELNQYISRTEATQFSVNKSIGDILSEIKDSVLFCNFDSAMNKINIAINNLKRENTEQKQVFTDIFTQIQKLLELWKNVFSQYSTNPQVITQLMNTTVTPQSLDIKMTLESLTKEKINQFDQNLIINLNEILQIMFGNIGDVMKFFDKSKMHFMINCILCYHFYEENFWFQFKEYFKEYMRENYPSDSGKIAVESIFGEIILHCDRNQYEFIQGIKGHIFYLVRFIMFDLIYNLDMIPDQGDGEIAADEYILLFNTLIESEIDFLDFSKFLIGFCGDNDKYNLFGIYSDYSIKYLNKILEEQAIKEESQGNELAAVREELAEKIKEIRKEVAKLMNMEHLLIKINEISFWKFYEYSMFDQAIDSYLEICELKNRINTGKSKYYKLEEDVLEEEDCLFDELISLISSVDLKSNKTIAAAIGGMIKEKIGVPIKVKFIGDYINFSIIIEEKKVRENKEVLRNFFDFCFVQKKCPLLMWVNIILKYKKIYKENTEFSKEILTPEMFAEGFKNLMTFESLIKQKIKRFTTSYDKDYSLCDRFFSDASEFLFRNKIEI